MSRGGHGVGGGGACIGPWDVDPPLVSRVGRGVAPRGLGCELLEPLGIEFGPIWKANAVLDGGWGH